jgi:alkane 1-monooxygenase
MADLSRIPEIGQWRKVLPFWVSYLLFPLIWVSAILGGWWVLLTPLLAWYLFSLLDLAFGLSHANEDPATDVSALAGYRWATLLWAPFQFVTIFGLLIYVSQSGHLNFWEQLGLFYSLGVMSGTIGINYSHEMMHQKTAVERGMADLLLAMVLYSHFRSEHLLVHHRYVGTPRGPGHRTLQREFLQVLPQGPGAVLFSAIRAERAMLRRAERGFFPSKESAIAICCTAGWLCSFGFWHWRFCRGAALCFSGFCCCLAAGIDQLC